MKEDRLQRTRMLFGDAAMEHLASSRVAVFGLGGVGGACVEALARSGIGALDVIDKDVVDVTNLNRQILATTDTIGRDKCDVARERILSVHPTCKVTCHAVFYLPETAEQFDFSQYDYIVDAVDTVTAKLEIITRAKDAGVKVISAMGAGNKWDPTAFRVADLFETSVDPLAKVMRRELKKRGVRTCKVVYSTEEPRKRICGGETVSETAMGDDVTCGTEDGAGRKKDTPGSVAFVPPVMGYIMAGEVIKELAFLE